MPEMLLPTGTNHDILYDDRLKKRETLIGHVNIFVKAEEELNRKTPVSFMMRSIEKIVSTCFLHRVCFMQASSRLK